MRISLRVIRSLVLALIVGVMGAGMGYWWGTREVK